MKRIAILRLLSLVLTLAGTVCFLLWLREAKVAWTTALLAVLSATGFGLTYKRLDVAAAVLVATTAGWMLQMADILAFMYIFGDISIPVVVYASAMFAAAAMAFVDAEYFWAKTNGKNFSAEKTLVIVACMLIPPISYIHRTHDIDNVSYRMYTPENPGSNARIALSIGDDSTGLIVVHDPITFKAIAVNSDIDSNIAYSDNCRIRIVTRFSQIQKITLIKNNTSGEFYDDSAILLPFYFDDSYSLYNTLRLRLTDLWW